MSERRFFAMRPVRDADTLTARQQLTSSSVYLMMEVVREMSDREVLVRLAYKWPTQILSGHDFPTSHVFAPVGLIEATEGDLRGLLATDRVWVISGRNGVWYLHSPSLTEFGTDFVAERADA